MIYGRDQSLQAGDAFAQLHFMTLQGAQHIESGASQDLLDVVERHTELAIQQDLLQTHQAGFVLVTITVLADPGGLEQANLIVIMQSTRGDAG